MIVGYTEPITETELARELFSVYEEWRDGVTMWESGVPHEWIWNLVARRAMERLAAKATPPKRWTLDELQKISDAASPYETGYLCEESWRAVVDAVNQEHPPS